MKLLLVAAALILTLSGYSGLGPHWRLDAPTALSSADDIAFASGSGRVVQLVSSYWPAGVPDTLWQFNLLVPEKGRSFPFVGIAVTWQFVGAFLGGAR